MGACGKVEREALGKQGSSLGPQPPGLEVCQNPLSPELSARSGCKPSKKGISVVVLWGYSHV